MAVTISLYNHTAKLFANKDVDLAALKLMLLNGHTYDATDTDLTGITGAQVSGNGWTSGGETLASVAVTVATTNDAKLDAADVSVTASGGTIGPADGAVIYDATGSYPLAYIDFGAEESAGSGADFKVTWNAAGIITWTNAA